MTHCSQLKLNSLTSHISFHIFSKFQMNASIIKTDLTKKLCEKIHKIDLAIRIKDVITIINRIGFTLCVYSLYLHICQPLLLIDILYWFQQSIVSNIPLLILPLFTVYRLCSKSSMKSIKNIHLPLYKVTTRFLN